MSSSLAFAHHDEPSFEVLFGGRPVWYALLTSPEFRRQVVSSFLSQQFPVVVIPTPSACVPNADSTSDVSLAPMAVLQGCDSTVVKDSAESPASLSANRHQRAGHLQLRHSEHPHTSCQREALVKQSKKWASWGNRPSSSGHFTPLLRSTGTVIRGTTQLSPIEETCAMQQRFLLWLSKCRHYVNAERVAEIMRSVAALMRGAADGCIDGTSSSSPAAGELSRLLKAVVEHPSERRRISIRVPTLQSPTSWTDDDILLLELVSFSFLPKNRMSMMKHSLANIPPSRLVSEPRLLSLSRRANAKHFAVDAGISIDALYRSKGVRTALDRWWENMPKRQSSGCADDGGVVLRSTFVQLMLVIQRELFGPEVFATQECIASAKDLADWDWPRITSLPAPPTTGSGVMSPRSMARGGGITGQGQPQHNSPQEDTNMQPQRASSFGAVVPGAVPKAASTQLMLSLASSLTPETTTLHQTLFEVAILTTIEPWMETVLPEERELCLAVLFERCFKEEDSSSFSLQSTAALGDHMKMSRRRVLQSVEPQATELVGEQINNSLIPYSPSSLAPGSSGAAAARTESPNRAGLLSSSGDGVGSSKIRAANILTGLVEQLDASTARNPRVVEMQQRRNEKEESDVAIAATQASWRRSLVEQRLADREVRQAHRAVASAIASGGLLPRDYRHHSAPQSYDLERVLLQRLSRQLTDAGPDKATRRAEHFLEATKRIIPPSCRREFALRNHQAVEDFKSTVEEVALRECGVKALAHDAAIVTAAIGTIPAAANYEKPKGDLADSSQRSSSSRMRQRIHRFFVQVPQTDPIESEDAGEQRGGDRTYSAPDTRQHELLLKPRSRPTSAAARPSSAARSVTSSVGIYSPFSHVGKLPTTLRPMTGGAVRKSSLTAPATTHHAT